MTYKLAETLLRYIKTGCIGLHVLTERIWLACVIAYFVIQDVRISPVKLHALQACSIIGVNYTEWSKKWYLGIDVAITSVKLKLYTNFNHFFNIMMMMIIFIIVIYIIDVQMKYQRQILNTHCTQHTSNADVSTGTAALACHLLWNSLEDDVCHHSAT